MWLRITSGTLDVCSYGETRDEAVKRALLDAPGGIVLGNIIAIRDCVAGSRYGLRNRYASTEMVCRRLGLWDDGTEENEKENSNGNL
jgi:hypothetical protein